MTEFKRHRSEAESSSSSPAGSPSLNPLLDLCLSAMCGGQGRHDSVLWFKLYSCGWYQQQPSKTASSVEQAQCDESPLPTMSRAHSKRQRSTLSSTMAKSKINVQSIPRNQLCLEIAVEHFYRMIRKQMHFLFQIQYNRNRTSPVIFINSQTMHIQLRKNDNVGDMSYRAIPNSKVGGVLVAGNRLHRYKMKQHRHESHCTT